MKKFLELDPSKVQVVIKNQSHLNELFEMGELFGLEICRDTYTHLCKYFRKSLACGLYSNYSNYFTDEDRTEVSTEQFYEILCHHYGYKGEIQ